MELKLRGLGWLRIIIFRLNRKENLYGNSSINHWEKWNWENNVT